jgi:hypothetical protein
MKQILLLCVLVALAVSQDVKNRTRIDSTHLAVSAETAVDGRPNITIRDKTDKVLYIPASIVLSSTPLLECLCGSVNREDY